jgi:Fungal chitosanase of glycosyl hydrolase group 75
VPQSLKDEIRDLKLTVRELRLGIEATRAATTVSATASENTGSSKKELSPLLLTIFGGIITGIFAILSSYCQAGQAHQLEEDKLRQSHQVKEDELRFTLIMKAIEQTDPDERKKALVFYVKTGLLKDPDGKIGKIEAKDIPQASESTQTIIFNNGAICAHVGDAVLCQSGLAIDVSGSPHAYHRDGKSGLDFTANAGRPGNWFGVVTDDAGTPVIQGPSDPAPGFFVSPTSLHDVSKALADPRGYVDSETIPFIVLPSDMLGKTGEPKLGDLAAVLNKANGKFAYAIVANSGPRRRFGEGSIALAIRLGLPSDPRRSGAASGITMVTFPGSGDGRPKTLEEIEAKTSKLFEAWGGLKRIELETQKTPSTSPASPTPSS